MAVTSLDYRVDSGVMMLMLAVTCSELRFINGESTSDLYCLRQGHRSDACSKPVPNLLVTQAGKEYLPLREVERSTCSFVTISWQDAHLMLGGFIRLGASRVKPAKGLTTCQSHENGPISVGFFHQDRSPRMPKAFIRVQPHGFLSWYRGLPPTLKVRSFQ
ncbi:hypothetical protein BU24DRAFT_413010 [Aaosphaeria arxii CBS 175.79]|uniref:Uncharacterized protein n=1 Tax=Aaosphaeria arxii CBS 175.79 TaxID=1450172 RepID=A0A6A5XEK5_9PLEO|nr:uncharacterized protein BU24DRAFT_413010 [Aaosphaeria arxii CBS 175.79]KAF2011340.1 hypothetical protein BU24DRAFT_413010 [Aaosphaeria arxii CBS 175.79]